MLKNKSLIIGRVQEMMQVKLRVRSVYYTVYAIHWVLQPMILSDLSVQRHMDRITNHIVELESAELIYACFCRARPKTHLQLTLIRRRRVANAIEETLRMDPRRKSLLKLLWQKSDLAQIMSAYLDEWLHDTFSHLNACRLLPDM